MKQLVLFSIGLIIFMYSCLQQNNKTEDKTVIFEYAPPFYIMNSGNDHPIIYGIKNSRFTYVEYENKPWLLYDRYVDSEININMVNSDEYTYIQLMLKQQLHALVKCANANSFTPIYSFYNNVSSMNY